MCRICIIISKNNKITNEKINSMMMFLLNLIEKDDNNPTLNIDGFGIGFYENEQAIVYKNDCSLTCDRNIGNILKLVNSSILCVHTRADCGTVKLVNHDNCHPFNYKDYIFCHNGYFDKYFNSIGRKQIINEIDDNLLLQIHGSTDSEYFFYLILTKIEKNNIINSIIDALKFMLDYNVVSVFYLTNGKTSYIMKYSNDNYEADLYITDINEEYILSSKKYNPNSKSIINNTLIVINNKEITTFEDVIK